MTIETKYNIGDEVWKMNCNNIPIKGMVVAIHISSKGVSYGVWFGGDVYYNSSNIIFPTKEELLKSL